MRLTRAIGLITGVVSVLGWAGAAPAQIEVGGLRLEGDVEAGARFFIEEPSPSRKSKFEEYRDINQGVFLENLRLRLFSPDEKYSVELGGSKWGLQDQEYSLRTGRLGLWGFGFDWDQMRHILSTNARMLATESQRGVFTLPTTRPALSLYNSASELDEISVRWDTAKIFFKLTPTPELDLLAEYTRIRKDGDRPMGMAFSSPGGNFMEVLQPIDQTIHDFRLGGTLAREQYQLQFGYTMSIFENDLRSMRADNPCFGAVAPVGCLTDGGAAAIATGQMSLPPENMAHTLSFQGGLNLPMRTRINGGFTWSLRLQNEAFLPHTINPALAANPDLALPEKSLNGSVQTFLVNMNATSRPFPVPVTLSLKYRYYDMRDFSNTITFPGVVVNDRSLSGARSAGRWDYQRNNADLDARWQIVKPLAATVGTGWERWDRNEHREVPESDEFFAKAALDWTPNDWMMVRATYLPSFRRINKYSTHAHAEHTVDEDAVALAAGQSLLLRKYDEAERDRHRADLLIQLMPTDSVTLTPTVGYRYDDYINSPLGLRQATTWSAGADLSWAPNDRLSFSGGYMHEVILQKQKSMMRTVIGGFATDFPDYQWISVNTDTVDTMYFGLKAALLPSRLDWTGNVNYTTATGRVETRNPTAPLSSTAANNYTARAKPMPAFEDNLIRVETALLYHFAKSWTAKLFYAYEAFDKHDWRTDTLNPFTPGISSIWLGNDQRNYTAQIMGLTLRYKFE